MHEMLNRLETSKFCFYRVYVIKDPVLFFAFNSSANNDNRMSYLHDFLFAALLSYDIVLK